MNNKGIALVITLLVLTLLLTIILEFGMDMRVEARSAANFRDEMKAYYLAKSGVTFAITVLEKDSIEDNNEGTRYDSLNEDWAKKLPPVPVGDGTVSVEITDEDSKINLNKLPNKVPDKLRSLATGQNMRALMSRFLKQFDVNESLTDEIPDSIADFIDEDSDELPNGAESSYYEGLEEHYSAKNKPLDSLQELRMIKGIDGDLFSKLNKFLTVNSDPLINVNTASREVLLSLFEDSIGSKDVVDEIIATRTEHPFQKTSDLQEHILDNLVYTNISKFIDVKSNFFSIKSTGEVNNSRKTITASVQRQGNKGTILYWRIE